jgi:serine/threonine protein kinase
MSERVQESDVIRKSINLSPTDLPGIHLPEDRDLLGEGKQGWAMYAEGADGTPYALKVHKIDASMSIEEAERSAQAFEDEGRWLQDFEHPNIVKVLQTGIHQRRISIGSEDSKIEYTREYRYMLMEYAELGSVSDRVKKHGILPVEEAALCILHSTEGMRYAHGELGTMPLNLHHRLTHGDLKDANLLVAGFGDRQRVVKVGDFGIARGAHSSVDTATSTQFHAFSLPYASENQIRTGNVFYTDDVYSLGGITAYKLLTGKLPIDPHDKSIFGYARAHGSSVVPPMERTFGGKADRMVDALNDPVLTALYRDPTDPKRKFQTMGEYQAAFKEALERGRTAAIKDKTIIILGGQNKTVPLTADQLLRGELPQQETHPEDAANAVTEAVTAGADQETDVVSGESRETHFLRNASGSRRNFLIGAGLLAVAGLTSGVIWAEAHSNETANEQAKREKLEQERKALTSFAYKVIDFLGHYDRANDVSWLLHQVIPYDPQGIVPRIKEVSQNDSSYSAAWLAADLVPFNPEAASDLMENFTKYNMHGEAVIVAGRLASFAHLPAAGKNYWQTKVDVIRAIIGDGTKSSKSDRQDYDKVLGATSDPGSTLAAQTLEEYGEKERYWAVQVLSGAIAPYNTQAVNREAGRWIDKANTTIDNIDDPDRSWRYALVGELNRVIAPYAPDLVAANIDRINIASLHAEEALDTIQQIVTELVPYKPEKAADYITKDMQVDNRQPNQVDKTILVALAKANSEFVKTRRLELTDTPYVEWIDASLDPLNSALLDKAYNALSADNQKYVGSTIHLLGALLKSRRPNMPT